MDRRCDSFYHCFRDALSQVQQARFLESFLGQIRPMALDNPRSAADAVHLWSERFPPTI